MDRANLRRESFCHSDATEFSSLTHFLIDDDDDEGDEDDASVSLPGLYFLMATSSPTSKQRPFMASINYECNRLPCIVIDFLVDLADALEDRYSSAVALEEC